MREQRAHNRRLMREDAIISGPSGERRQPAILLDISRVGVCFTSPQLLPSGTVYRLEFSLPGQPGLHRTTLEVVHSSSSGVPSGYRVGARFLDIAPDTAERIMDFVTKDVDMPAAGTQSKREADRVQHQANQTPD